MSIRELHHTRSSMSHIARLTILIAIYILSTTNPCLAISKDLIIYYIEYPPYYYTENDTPKGIIIDITDKILKKSKITYTFNQLPSKRVLAEVKSSQNAASIGWFRTREREKDYIFSNPIYTNKPLHLLIRTDSAEEFLSFKTLESILTSNKFRIGEISGHSEGAFCDSLFRKYPSSVHFIAGDQSQLLKMLRARRIDAILIAPEEESSLEKEADIPHDELAIIQLEDIPCGNNRHMIFNKNADPNIIERINTAIDSIKTDH